MNTATIQEHLTTRELGRVLHYVPEINSTNEDCRKRGEAGDPEGTVVVADYQTAGKGRLGRRWEASRGKDLLFSVLLRPKVSP